MIQGAIAPSPPLNKTLSVPFDSRPLTSICSGLSYWLSRRLPISDREKLHLLSLHCPTLRLIRGLMILEVSVIP